MSNRTAISSYKNGLPLPRAFYFGQLRAETEIRTTGRSRVQYGTRRNISPSVIGSWVETWRLDDWQRS